MVYQYRPEWSGTSGGPGVTVFNARQSSQHLGDWGQPFAEACQNFFSDVAVLLPDDLTINFPAEVLELDTATGELVSVEGVDPPAQVVGTYTDGYATPVGARVDWITPAIVAGRRLRGRTYLVPIGANQYDQSGTITTAALAVIQGAANNLLTAMDELGALAVWSRTHGIMADIGSASIPDEAAVLRSRRD